MTGHSFLILGANTPWVYALGNSLSREHRTHVVRIYDWFNYLRLKPRWPGSEKPGKFTRSQWLMPPGYTGKLAFLVQPFLRGKIRRLCKRLEEESGTRPWIIVTYPWLMPALRNVAKLIYYNLDDYSQYRPERTAVIHKLEDELMQRSSLTLCLSQYQVDHLQEIHNTSRRKPVHFPLGVSRQYLNPQPEAVPRERSLGYIGNLQERVDWAFVRDVARQCEDVTFIFVGHWQAGDGNGAKHPWEVLRQEVSKLANVKFSGPVPQEDVAKWYWSFGINWIPYATDNAFNMASCPTKIMDGLASGRPMLSTDIPECRLYGDWIKLVHTPREASQQIHELLYRTVADSERAREQVRFASQHDWQARAEILVSMIEQL